MTIKAMLAGGVIALGAVAPAALAQNADGQRLVIKIAGEGRWSASCELVNDAGEPVRPSADGRGSRSSGTLVARDVVSGTCTATASDRGPMRVTIDARRGVFVCPFTAGLTDECVGDVTTGDSEEFAIALN